jgi:hypothetical protein
MPAEGRISRHRFDAGKTGQILGLVLLDFGFERQCHRMPHQQVG